MTTQDHNHTHRNHVDYASTSDTSTDIFFPLEFQLIPDVVDEQIGVGSGPSRSMASMRGVKNTLRATLSQQYNLRGQTQNRFSHIRHMLGKNYTY